MLRMLKKQQTSQHGWNLMSEKECDRRWDWQILLGQITFGYDRDFGYDSKCDGKPNAVFWAGE